jgi:hypothetical protein
VYKNSHLFYSVKIYRHNSRHNNSKTGAHVGGRSGSPVTVVRVTEAIQGGVVVGAGPLTAASRVVECGKVSHLIAGADDPDPVLPHEIVYNI